jgi:hypothetical protein
LRPASSTAVYYVTMVSSRRMVPLLLAALSLCVHSPAPKTRITNPALAARIESLFHSSFTAEDDGEQAAEAKRIYSQRGLPTVAEVGDLPAYEFVVLLASGKLSTELRDEILAKAKDAAAQHDLPPDALEFYEARLRLEKIKTEAETHPPTNPALRDEIDRMFEVDQAVRQQHGFDPKKLQKTDAEHAAPLEMILNKYGVPTYPMVGPEAAGEFVIMIQHQSARFRQEVLPKLKANVDAGQADPESYALVYDRSQRDLGKKQLYGQQLECNAGESLHEAPIEDEGHLNERRAQLGLIRVELYLQIGRDMMPQFCPPSDTKK